MKLNRDKVVSLKQAVCEIVRDGCHLSIGGFTINRNPMAAVHEIIRQKIRNLHLYVHSNGQGVDELIGAGCVSKIEIAYGGTGKFAATCIRFRKAVQDGSLQIEDYTNYQMTLRFLAGAMGLPFLPTRSSLGTDILNKWGFSSKMRAADSQIPNKKMAVLDNPFDNWADAEKVVLVPAINPDVTIIHVQQADKMGNCRMQGLSFADVEQAKAAKKVIVTCEELFESDELRENSDRNQIPFIHVDAVVHMPFGAYPTACYHHYDYDPIYLKAYSGFAKDDALFDKYLQDHVYELSCHQDLLDMVGSERLEMITADSPMGYAENLVRG